MRLDDGFLSIDQHVRWVVLTTTRAPGPWGQGPLAAGRIGRDVWEVGWIVIFVVASRSLACTAERLPIRRAVRPALCRHVVKVSISGTDHHRA